jgi:hypothetical protein
MRKKKLLVKLLVISLVSFASCRGKDSPFIVESCILLPEAKVGMCYHELAAPQDYELPLDEMQYFWCTNPEDASRLIKEAQKRKMNLETLGFTEWLLEHFQ